MAAAQRNSKAEERFEDTAAALPLKGKIRTLFSEASGFRQGEEQHPRGLAPQGGPCPRGDAQPNWAPSCQSLVPELVKIHPK